MHRIYILFYIHKPTRGRQCRAKLNRHVRGPQACLPKIWVSVCESVLDGGGLGKCQSSSCTCCFSALSCRRGQCSSWLRIRGETEGMWVSSLPKKGSWLERECSTVKRVSLTSWRSKLCPIWCDILRNGLTWYTIHRPWSWHHFMLFILWLHCKKNL